MKKIRTSPKGRTCRYPHCGKILSIYNHEQYCHIHLGRIDHGHKHKFSKEI